MLPSCLRPHVSHRVIVIGAIGRQATATISSASQGEAQATAGIANHLEKFWDPRMRSPSLRTSRPTAPHRATHAPGNRATEGQGIQSLTSK
jgi:uncharacterized membrane protein